MALTWTFLPQKIFSEVYMQFKNSDPGFAMAWKLDANSEL